MTFTVRNRQQMAQVFNFHGRATDVDFLHVGTRASIIAEFKHVNISPHTFTNRGQLSKLVRQCNGPLVLFWVRHNAPAEVQVFDVEHLVDIEVGAVHPEFAGVIKVGTYPGSMFWELVNSFAVGGVQWSF